MSKDTKNLHHMQKKRRKILLRIIEWIFIVLLPTLKISLPSTETLKGWRKIFDRKVSKNLPKKKQHWNFCPCGVQEGHISSHYWIFSAHKLIFSSKQKKSRGVLLTFFVILLAQYWSPYWSMMVSKRSNEGFCEEFKAVDSRQLQLLSQFHFLVFYGEKCEIAISLPWKLLLLTSDASQVPFPKISMHIFNVKALCMSANFPFDFATL